ncbi:sulfurtransferase [Tenacibaculum sp. nBUS_03]|uniref:sulfurtransferase n=1 Tax=Tenacibaculum sp. nBUS_03 TaxID=3395320 RepID=UPI003EB9EB9E
MNLKINSPVVDVEWLENKLTAENLIILDATIKKVTTKKNTIDQKKQIVNAVFFDLKNVFLKKEAKYPNTLPSKEYFQKEARKLGVNNDSCIIVYDDIGVYSSARVWWMFKTFGFNNIAVLNGGLPAWKKAGFLVEEPQEREIFTGNFRVNFRTEKVSYTKDVIKATANNNVYILDARSKGRFEAKEPEPRADLRGGHIPSSFNLAYTEVQNINKMKGKEELEVLFSKVSNNSIIFTCGSGITACILALGAEILGIKNYAVYDGSWTEWASNLELPIEK